MALPNNLCDREMDKFCEDSLGQTTVRVCADEPVPVSGNFAFAVTGPIKVTGESVNDTSAAFPSVNQVGRASLSIRNVDPANSIYIVNSVGISRLAAGADIWEIGPNETLNTDFDDTNKVNLVTDSGQVVLIQILEIRG